LVSKPRQQHIIKIENIILGIKTYYGGIFMSEKTGEIKGKAKEMKGEIKGKAKKMEGEIKGKAKEIEGEMKGKAKEAEGKNKR